MKNPTIEKMKDEAASYEYHSCSVRPNKLSHWLECVANQSADPNGSVSYVWLYAGKTITEDKAKHLLDNWS